MKRFFMVLQCCIDVECMGPGAVCVCGGGK